MLLETFTLPARPGIVPGVLAPERLALGLPAVFTSADCARWVQGTLAARAHWHSDFGGQQFTLGRAWYTHLEQRRTGDYFAHAAAADALVEQHAPGLRAAIFSLASRVVAAPVAQRPGWCGPGVHVFPPGSEVARLGGTIHYDTEGLPKAHLEAHAPALSLVVMLQPAQRGGGLRLWPARHGEHHERAEPPGEPALLSYAVGDAALFTSYRLHQIEPFAGETARISATAHLAFETGAWHVWF
jgi:hypothetical protein